MNSGTDSELMTAINNKPSLAAIGPGSLYTQLTGNSQDSGLLHQASYDVLLLREVFYQYAKNHWVADFKSFIELNKENVNISQICQSITRTRKRRRNKQNNISLAYLNGLL